MNERRAFNELRIMNQGCLQLMNKLCTINEPVLNKAGYQTITFIVKLPTFNTNVFLPVQ